MPIQLQVTQLRLVDVDLAEPTWQNVVPLGRSEVVPNGSQGLAVPKGPHGQVPNPTLLGRRSPLLVPLRTPLFAVRCLPTWQHAMSFGARESSRRGVRDRVGFNNDRRTERVLCQSAKLDGCDFLCSSHGEEQEGIRS
ncbi:hypothetical protein SO802_015703 [Lithocarpus litseifolius]|uniref:Uncharacterized protein n=1 Tax=Lithocarpus litseifolius TaxID=425828 RepID=A0AAW2CWR3_9ROSI